MEVHARGGAMRVHAGHDGPQARRHRTSSSSGKEYRPEPSSDAACDPVAGVPGGSQGEYFFNCPFNSRAALTAERANSFELGTLTLVFAAQMRRLVNKGGKIFHILFA